MRQGVIVRPGVPCQEGDVFVSILGKMFFASFANSDDDGDDEETSGSLFTTASKWWVMSQGREYGPRSRLFWPGKTVLPHGC